MNQDLEELLVQSALRGDVDSFTELCSRYYPAMVALAHSVLGDKHLAEDTAQETFAKACSKLKQLKNKNKFAFWLSKICRNTAMDLVRRKEKHLSLENVALVAEERGEEDKLIGAVKEAIDKLNSSLREVVFLRYYDGMTYERISLVLGISKQAINGRLRRAKKKIAVYLKQNNFVEVDL